MSDVENPQVLETPIDPVVEQVNETVSEAVEAAPEAIESLQDRLIDTVTTQQQEALEAVESTGQVLIEAFSRARIELSDFMATRFREELEAQQALLRCRSFDEVREVQVKFVRTAIDQYGDEAAKLVRLGGEVATRSFERV